MTVYGPLLYLQIFRFLACGLKTVGVVFEDYDLPGLKTVNHVCVLGAEKTAWFKDTAENFLVHSRRHCVRICARKKVAAYHRER